MFHAAALTRKVDIERSGQFDPCRDKVVVLEVKDVSDIKNLVQKTVKENSEIYGPTVEFGIWSHAGTDGPTGTVPTMNNALDGKQMTLEGWGDINFNWANNGDRARANFMGCRTGVKGTESSMGGDNGMGGILTEYNETPSFVETVSQLSNLKNVTVAGQTSSSFPSRFTNYRLNSENGTDNFINSEKNGTINFQRTYLVGGVGRKDDWNRNEKNVANPMRFSKNGATIKLGYQSGDKKKN